LNFQVKPPITGISSTIGRLTVRMHTGLNQTLDTPNYGSCQSTSPPPRLNTVSDIIGTGIQASGCGNLLNGSGKNNFITVGITNIPLRTVESVSKSAAVTQTLKCEGNKIVFTVSGNTVTGNTTNINVTGGPGHQHELRGGITDNPAIKPARRWLIARRELLRVVTVSLLVAEAVPKTLCTIF